MFDPSQKSTGTGYTMPVAWLAVAFVFVPAVLAASHPFGYASLSLAIVCSALCVALAWISWKRSSQLSIPSIAVRGAKAK
jgi:hypothetical protein